MLDKPLRLPPAAAAGTLLLLAPALAAAGSGPTITPLVVEGDSVPGVGLVTTINNLAVNSNGDWLVEADTDAAVDFDLVLLRNGVLELREGDAPPAFPVGATLSSFDSVTLNDAGQCGFNFFLDGLPTSEDSSVDAYLDTSGSIAAELVEVIQESETVPDLSPGTPLIGIFDVKVDTDGALLVTASVDDPAIPTTVDRALVLWTTDPDTGGVVTSTLIAAEGDVLPGQAVALSDFGTGPHETAVHDGNVLFAVDIPGGLDAIYGWDGGFTEIAQEGDPSPVAGRNWASLTSTSLDVSASHYVFRGTLDGATSSDSVLILDGSAVVIQEGDSLPAIGGVFTFTSFGTGPVVVSDSGDVLWYGDWNDPDTDVDTGLFLNDTLLVQEGVTSVPGLGVIDTLRGITDGYQMSDDGRYVIFEAVLVGGLEGAFLVELGGIFSDGFESGDTTAWTLTVGG